MTKHKHYDVIIAYANGAEVQVRSRAIGGWEDVEHPVFHADLEYRVKPVIIRYRLALFSNAVTGSAYISITYRDHEEELYEHILGFKRWLGDWQEVEV